MKIEGRTKCFDDSLEKTFNQCIEPAGLKLCKKCEIGGTEHPHLSTSTLVTNRMYKQQKQQIEDIIYNSFEIIDTKGKGIEQVFDLFNIMLNEAKKEEIVDEPIPENETIKATGSDDEMTQDK